MTDALMFATGVHTERDFVLESGAVLPVAEVAYVTLGRLNADRSNAILLAHGYTSSHTFVLEGSAAAEGSWSELVGPGRAIDTDRYFVISSNALGSCYGSTGPGSVNPETGKPYGPDFPAVRFADIARLQKVMLSSLGVDRLHAAVGVSMGGFQVLQWGVQYPDDVGKIVVALSSPAGLFRAGEPDATGQALRADPAWNDGHPEPRAMVPLLADIRMKTLLNYGMDAWLAAQGQTEPQRLATMRQMAEEWAEGFDSRSLLVLRDAISHFDVVRTCGAIRASVLLVLSTTDAIFPASQGPDMLRMLRGQGVDVRFHELESPFGHLASGLDWQRWAAPLQDFLA
ncbi:MAG: alpha/beta fold hydrolase [Ottowia sp.]|uniref:alpha/beta fold hydrolase n=1 Tax=Ottowia sp. TaxID=1898956 RepID=UPI003C75A050